MLTPTGVVEKAYNLYVQARNIPIAEIQDPHAWFRTNEKIGIYYIQLLGNLEKLGINDEDLKRFEQSLARTTKHQQRYMAEHPEEMSTVHESTHAPLSGSINITKSHQLQAFKEKMNLIAKDLGDQIFEFLEQSETIVRPFGESEYILHFERIQLMLTPDMRYALQISRNNGGDFYFPLYNMTKLQLAGIQKILETR